MNLSEPSTKIILIVDDDENIRELLELLLKREGFNIEKAEDGKKAIEKAKKIKPDLIILDLMLPVYGGFEILRELQSDENGKIPIIIITGKYMDRTLREMIIMEPNVKSLIEKPIKHEVLITTVHNILKTNPKKNK